MQQHVLLVDSQTSKVAQPRRRSPPSYKRSVTQGYEQGDFFLFIEVYTNYTTVTLHLDILVLIQWQQLHNFQYGQHCWRCHLEQQCSQNCHNERPL